MILDMAMGGSTNTVLHMLAIAHEAGVPYDMAADQRAEPQDAQHLQGRPQQPLPRRGRRTTPAASTRSSASVARGRPGLLEPRLLDRHRQDAGREHRRVRRPRRHGRRRRRAAHSRQPGGVRSPAWSVPRREQRAGMTRRKRSARLGPRPAHGFGPPAASTPTTASARSTTPTARKAAWPSSTATSPPTARSSRPPA